MKKKLAMRIASLALCIVFVGALFGVPKAKAVAVEAAAVSIGAAVLSSYLIATNMDLIGDTAETISNGISSLVSDWVTASGVADSGDSWLSSLGTAAQVRNPGVLIVPGALAAGCAAFVAWLTETFGLDEDGKEAVVMPESADRYLYNGVELPVLPALKYSTQVIARSGDAFSLHDLDATSLTTDGYKSAPSVIYRHKGHCLFRSFIGDASWIYIESRDYDFQTADAILWSNVDIFHPDGTLYCAASVPVPAGDVANQLELVRNPGFSNIANNAEEADELAIYTALPGVTLEELAADIPAQIAAGTLAPTAELTQTGEGEGTEDDTVIGGDSTTVGLLQSILEKVKTIPDSIVQGVSDLFTPSQEAVDSLSAEVDSKLPFIPVLKDFGADLAYNLEHPEECVDEIGFTTIVDLGKGRGTELGNAKIDLLDVSWYLEYKPFVDDVIVGFVWLVFLWNLYGALPKIIHGEGSLVHITLKDEKPVGSSYDGFWSIGDD